MFRFWSNDSRGSGQTIVETHQPMQLDTTRRPTQLIAPRPLGATISTFDSGRVLPAVTSVAATAEPVVSPPATAGTKRSWDEVEADDAVNVGKRAKHELSSEAEEEVSKNGASPSAQDMSFTSHLSDPKDRVKDAIEFHFSLEVLHKHDELRLIDQELAKCQVALEQLRRCHLIPYPVNCPTPDQMVDICNGKGPALLQRGKDVPVWAAPFGVVDGPYARHYAKWLIPDPMFDGMLPEWRGPWHKPASSSRVRSSPEGRTTRNSLGEVAVKGRPVRGNAGQKLQALTTGGAPPREKGACILERKRDGVMVKLVCVDCYRGDFLSIQGFINHCRIAHRRDFKSHEEAAIHCGHPVDAPSSAAPPTTGEEKTPVSASAVPAAAAASATTSTVPPTPASALAPPPSFLPPAPPSGLVHPLARAEATTQSAYQSLHSRVKQSIDMFHQGQLPGVASVPDKKSKKSSGSFASSNETPYLSALMQSKQFGGDLQQLVDEAKMPLDLDDLPSPGEEFDDMMDSPGSRSPVSQAPMMRIPARTAMAAPVSVLPRPTSRKGPPPIMPYSQPVDLGRPMVLPEEDVDMESPNMVTSNVAPSLISDDSEYDDSDACSTKSDCVSDSLDAESISDVTEINMDDDVEASRCDGPHGSTVRLRKDEDKAVTIVSPAKNVTAPPKERRVRNAEKY